MKKSLAGSFIFCAVVSIFVVSAFLFTVYLIIFSFTYLPKLGKIMVFYTVSTVNNFSMKNGNLILFSGKQLLKVLI